MPARFLQSLIHKFSLGIYLPSPVCVPGLVLRRCSRTSERSNLVPLGQAFKKKKKFFLLVVTNLILLKLSTYSSILAYKIPWTEEP